ncbi:MAG: hypothetical protein COC19_07610 [SAR86 cluster bacterium]|uniref:Pyrimidine/purine nucleoside phosphorylase n=1 Tax=SAR86 cluster bacterium TaxID=2030880 RepID=A0A2A4MGU2_9GAMM|nr:MAG: hypothetical protein COC19_07610 [SAR86 cluster bacterium]
MSTFENVTIVKAANIYFDGKVTSRTVEFADGSTKTLGMMMAGEYEFGTDKKEIMEVLGGEICVLLAGESNWKSYGPGESFEVPGNSKFNVKINSIADYCCSYID